MMTRAVPAMLLALTVTLLALLPARSASAYPQPSIVPLAWEFDFNFEQPKPIAVRGVDGVIRWYWYMKYKVVNNTGEERLFIPQVTVATQEGDIVRAGRGVPAIVFKEVKERIGNRLLESPAQVVGKILQGEDQAKESVAIWPAFDHDVSDVSVFVGGLSGEVQEVPHPITGSTVLLHKTLMLNFEFPGIPETPQNQIVKYRGKDWVMR